MPPLDRSLQVPFADALSRLAIDARATATALTKTGFSEVDWIENFHALVATNLAADLRARVRAQGQAVSVAVGTALVHGSPFRVTPNWGHGSSPSIEIGDLLFVGERHEVDGLKERQALLLQMKVGAVVLRSAAVSGPTRQAALFAEWPPITWSVTATCAGLPGPFPRTPSPGPCDAAQFGIIPDSAAGPSPDFDALPLIPGPAFGNPRPLLGEIARTLRLDLGIDATPGPRDGWPRIVEDILHVAPITPFRAGATRPARHPAAAAHRLHGAHRGRFVVVVVGFGGPGVLD
jgi:hypothetical protein